MVIRRRAPSRLAPCDAALTGRHAVQGVTKIIPPRVFVFNSSSTDDMIDGATDDVDDAIELVLSYDDRRRQADYVAAHSRK